MYISISGEIAQDHLHKKVIGFFVTSWNTAGPGITMGKPLTEGLVTSSLARGSSLDYYVKENATCTLSHDPVLKDPRLDKE